MALLPGVAIVTPSVASAEIVNVPPGGASVIVEIGIDGTVYDDSGTAVKPCPPGYTFDYTTDLGSIEAAGDSGHRVTRERAGITEVLFWSLCYRDPALRALDAELESPPPGVVNQESFWIGVPDEGAVIDEAWKQVQELITPPVVSWPTMNREFEWLYVNADMEFRVAGLAPVSATASLENILDAVTATVTATPVSVTFFSGEPTGGQTTCSIDDAGAGFHPDVIGACSYKYAYSSASGPDGRTFTYRMVVDWDVTGDLRPGDPTTVQTFVEDTIAVAEIQAIETTGR